MDYFYADVERVTGVKRLRLHHWMKEGFLIPSGQVAKGHGTKNIYTRGDLYKIALLKKLIENGIHGWVAATALMQDFESLQKVHQQQKENNLPGVVVCLVLLISNGTVNGLEVINNFGDLFGTGPSLSEQIFMYFNKFNYDEAILFNFEKLFDEIDSRLQ